MEQPSVGRRVHYVSHGSPVREDGTQAYAAQCRAAIITEVTEHPDADQTCGLAVLNPEGMFFKQGVPADFSGAAKAGGTWHWPERT
jgi:hypothetical protein